MADVQRTAESPKAHSVPGTTIACCGHTVVADGPPAAATAAPPPKTALTPAQAGLPAPAAPEEPFDVKGGTQEVKKATAQLLVQLALTGDATAVLR